MSGNEPDFKEEVETEVDEEITEPPMYKVLLHNDDYTSKEFVVQVLVAIFHKSTEEAMNLMWHVHKNGRGVCGVYTYDVAETKVNTVTAVARENGFPLRTSIEEE